MIGAGVSLPVMRESAFRRLLGAEPIAASRPSVSVAEDETYWREIQRAFDLDRTMVNLNNGGCSPAPTRERGCAPEASQRKSELGDDGAHVFSICHRVIPSVSKGSRMRSSWAGYE